MLVPFLDAVGELGIGPFVLICGYDSVERLALRAPVSISFFSLREPDFIKLLKELRPVVVLIQDFHNDPGNGGSGKQICGFICKGV